MKLNKKKLENMISREMFDLSENLQKDYDIASEDDFKFDSGTDEVIAYDLGMISAYANVLNTFLKESTDERR